MTPRAAVQDEILAKIGIERKVLEGALAMLKKLTDSLARQQCEMNALESQRRIDFLEGELAKLVAKTAGVGVGGVGVGVGVGGVGVGVGGISAISAIGGISSSGGISVAGSAHSLATTTTTTNSLSLSLSPSSSPDLILNNQLNLPTNSSSSSSSSSSASTAAPSSGWGRRKSSLAPEDANNNFMDHSHLNLPSAAATASQNNLTTANTTTHNNNSSSNQRRSSSSSNLFGALMNSLVNKNTSSAANSKHALVGAASSNAVSASASNSTGTSPRGSVSGGAGHHNNALSPYGSQEVLATPNQQDHQTHGVTRLDFLKFGTQLSNEKIAFRLRHIKSKMDLELKVRAGTENLISAMNSGGGAGQLASTTTSSSSSSSGGESAKLKLELESKVVEANAKISFLQKSEQQLSGLLIGKMDEDEDLNHMADIRQRRTGRLKLRIVGGVNLPGKRSSREDYFAVVRVDGIVKATTKSTKARIDETFDIQVEKALEVEIAVYDKPGAGTGGGGVAGVGGAGGGSSGSGKQPPLLLSFVWFNLADIEEDMTAKFGPNFAQKHLSASDMSDVWLDMEPGGQIAVKMNFAAVARTRTERDQVFRRQAVQKLYPRNGHKFAATQFYQVLQCAVCNEFLGGQGYQCQNCQYVLHPRCYNRCITKCITKEEHKAKKSKGEDANTGQLLKYTIPHRFDAVTNISASWCSHCGYILPVGRKIMRCTECNKCTHKDCQILVPHFCGLNPTTADQLVAAFEEHEKKLHQKELEEAEVEAHKRNEANAKELAQAPPGSGSFVADVAMEEKTGGVTQKQTPSASSPRRPSEIIVSPPNDYKPTPSPRTDSMLNAALAQMVVESDPKTRHSEVMHPKPSSSYEKSHMMHSAPNSAPQSSPISHISAIPESEQQHPRQVAAVAEVSLNDFHFIAVLGRGAFGKVMLATEKQTGQLYAIKALKKEFIIQSDDVKSTRLEKRIFQAASAAHHPFLVNLHSSFQTDARVYFVMEYVCGGDLMCHIQEKKRFNSSRTRFYACEVLLAIDYFHRNNIIYRDLKLDNILMMPDGHIKVADYGICKDNIGYGMTTRTFCGTPDYMAPEILLSNRYGRAVDWWSFGVLIYVMLMGRYPFHGEDENQILDAILDDAIDYPPNLPRETFSVLQQLLNKNPAKRLGGGRGDAEEVKRHPYFAQVDWDAMLRKEIPPPWKPIVSHATDVSNFDQEFTKEKPVLTPINSILSEVHQNEFKDFNYVSEWAKDARRAGAH